MMLESLFRGEWPRTILLDLDGTLVDSAPDLAAAIDQMLRALGREPAGEDPVRQWVGNGAAILVRRAMAGRLDYESGPILDETDFRQALDLFFTAYADLNGRHSSIYPGVIPFLQAARDRGCRLGVVTNKPAAFTAKLLELLELASWFDILVSGDTLPVLKPDPAPIHHAIECLNGETATTLMVGDSGTDVQAAKNAGVPVVCLRYGYNHDGPVDELGADIVVDSLTELL